MGLMARGRIEYGGVGNGRVVLGRAVGQRLECRDSGLMVRRVGIVRVRVPGWGCNLYNNLTDRKVRMVLRVVIDASTVIVLGEEEAAVSVRNTDLREDSGGTKSLVENVFVEKESSAMMVKTEIVTMDTVSGNSEGGIHSLQNHS
jgi:hypothetical protein